MKHSMLQGALRELDAVRFEDTAMPKQVHMTARSRVLEGDVLANFKHIQAQNPDWRLTVYDDADIEAFLGEQFGPHVLGIYRALNTRYGAAREDLFRYLCVFRLGGLYLDLKSTTTMSLDQWIRASDRFILSQWDNGPDAKYSDWGLHAGVRHISGGEYQQWFVAASPGHPYLRAVCERVLRNIVSYGPVPARFGRQGVLHVTGPIAYSQAIHAIRDQHPHRFLDVEREGGLRYSFYEGQGDHFKLSAVHYSVLTEPIVRLPAFQTRVFGLARTCQGHWQAGHKRIIANLVKLKRLLRGAIGSRG